MASLLRRSVVGLARTGASQRCVPLAPASVRRFGGGDGDLVLVERRDNGVALLTLNRPKALNALSDAVLRELVARLKEVDADGELRASVITGSGKAFAAGADIKEMDGRESYAAVRAEDMLAHWDGVAKCRKPIIAAVNGFALGGGCELAMSCDIILADESAKFGQPEIKLGTIPGCGGTQRLLRSVGKSRAMEWVLTGEMFSAADAERAGLVSRVVPKGTVVEEALAVAAKIASFSSPVVQLAKEAVNRAEELALAEGLHAERQLFHATWALEDRRRGMQAFIEKASPEWGHQ